MSHPTRALAIVALAAASSFAAPALANPYQAQTLSLPGASNINAFDINNAGQVVGSLELGGMVQPFVWQDGSMEVRSLPDGALAGYFIGISDGGLAVGAWSNSLVDDGNGNMVPGNFQGLIDDDGGVTISRPGAQETFLRGISPDGFWISGYSVDSDGTVRGFVFDRNSGVYTDVGLANSRFPLPQGINAFGQVAGSDFITSDDGNTILSRPGFIYDIDSGTRFDIQLPGTQRTAFRDIDSNFVPAGWVRYPDAGNPAGRTVGWIGLEAGAVEVSFGDGSNTTIQGLNDAGWISGSYAIGDQFFGYVAAPVPEPTPALLLLAGLVTLAWHRKVRRPR
jgi:uncharacterized membrane protein